MAMVDPCDGDNPGSRSHPRPPQGGQTPLWGQGTPMGPPSTVVLCPQGRNVVNGDVGWFPCAAVRPFICVSTGTPKPPERPQNGSKEPQGLGTVRTSPKFLGCLGIWREREGSVGYWGGSRGSHPLSPSLTPLSASFPQTPLPDLSVYLWWVSGSPKSSSGGPTNPPRPPQILPWGTSIGPGHPPPQILAKEHPHSPRHPMNLPQGHPILRGVTPQPLPPCQVPFWGPSSPLGHPVTPKPPP